MKLCACNLPIHHLVKNQTNNADRLPVGLQLMGRFGEDEKLLTLAARLEQVFGRAPLPELNTDT